MELLKIKTRYSQSLLLSVLEFIYWSGNGMFYSYYVPFMGQKGLSNSRIGLVLSISSVLLILTLPIWGILSDKLKSPKLVMAVMFVCSAIIMLFIPRMDNTMLIAVSICLIAIFESGLASIIDSYLVQVIDRVPGASYGNIRVWGSIGIIVSLAFSARIVATFGPKIVFYYYGVCLLLLLPLLGFLPSITPAYSQKGNTNYKELFLDLRYVSFLIFVTMLFIPYRFSVSFLSQSVQFTSGKSEDLSIALIVSYGSEVAFYFLSIYLFKHFKMLKIIFISGSLFILRQLLFALAWQPYQVSLIQLTQGPTFTLLTAASVIYINRIAPNRLKSTAQAVGNAVMFGVSGVISNALGGYLLDSVGIVKTYYAGTALSLAAVIAYASFWVTQQISKKYKIKIIQVRQ